MKVSEAFPSNYLKAADLGGRTIRAKINIVRSEDIGGDQKLVIYFQGKEKGLVLNKTNSTTIAMAFGDETDNWTDAPIELFPQAVPFNGQMVPAIRVRIPPEDQPTHAAPQPNGGTFAPNARARAEKSQYDERNPPPRATGTSPTASDDDIPF